MSTINLHKPLAAALAAALALGAPVEALARTVPTQRFPPVSFFVDETEKLQGWAKGGVNSQNGSNGVPGAGRRRPWLLTRPTAT